MMSFFRDFVKDEQSQDILDYTFLLVGFVVLSAIVVYTGAGSGVKAIFAGGNSVLAAANTAAG